MFYTCLKCYEMVNKRELKLLVEVVVFDGIDNIIVVKRFSHLDHWFLALVVGIWFLDQGTK